MKKRKSGGIFPFSPLSPAAPDGIRVFDDETTEIRGTPRIFFSERNEKMNSNNQNPLPQKKKRKRSFSPAILVPFLLIGLIVAVVIAAKSGDSPTPVTAGEDPATTVPAVTRAVPPEVPIAEPHAWTTASVGVTGDILIHSPILSNNRTSDGSYDFTGIYEPIKPYFESYDCMIANLEVPFGGTEAGAYSGYPLFNCPDVMADALKGAGVDLLLTANNHSNDAGHNGLVRTQNVLNEKEIPYLGTRLESTDSFVKVLEINEIRIGMTCYTYSYAGTLNGLPLRNGDTVRVHSFEYGALEAFYENVQKDLDEMRAGGAEFTMFYIHWGNEYQFSPNSYQKQMAQRLCEMGVDVIVGGHPHVIQPYDTLTSESGHKTLCLYSTGNAISNQRHQYMDSEPTGHTEDGVIFGVTFEKWSDGTVRIGSLEILPTWVDYQHVGGRYVYRILPLDVNDGDWSRYQPASLQQMKNSYNRTLALVGAGLNGYRSSLGLEAVPLKID